MSERTPQTLVGKIASQMVFDTFLWNRKYANAVGRAIDNLLEQSGQNGNFDFTEQDSPERQALYEKKTNERKQSQAREDFKARADANHFGFSREDLNRHSRDLSSLREIPNENAGRGHKGSSRSRA